MSAEPYYLGPAFMSLALLRFADEAIQDILKLEGSKGHTDSFDDSYEGSPSFLEEGAGATTSQNGESIFERHRP